MNIIEGLQQEMNRNRELLKLYQEIGMPGMFGAAIIKNNIASAERAIAQGDTVGMVRIYQELKEAK